MKCVTTHALRLLDIVNNERCRHKEKLALVYRTRRLGCPSHKTTQSLAISFIINLCLVQNISLSHRLNKKTILSPVVESQYLCLTPLIVLWTTLSTIQKRKAKKMQMIGRPHSSLAGSCAVNEQKLQAHTFSGILLKGSITSANDTGRWKTPSHPRTPCVHLLIIIVL